MRDLGGGNVAMTKQEVFDTAENLKNMVTNYGGQMPPGFADTLMRASAVILALVQALDSVGSPVKRVPGIIMP
ncbi:MAG TPA: hypothetical protein VFE77_03130 [Rhodanobacter sp.]|nr:hypothetical protein [Rhodanobacter sp.]